MILKSLLICESIFCFCFFFFLQIITESFENIIFLGILFQNICTAFRISLQTVYTHVCAHTFTQHACTQIYSHTFPLAHTCSCTHTCVHVCAQYAHTYTHTHVSGSLHLRTYIFLFLLFSFSKVQGLS